MKTLPLIACLLVYSSAQAADNGLSKCSEVKSDIERLQCFDDLVKVRGALSPVATTASKGAWTLQTETSKINDSQNVTLAVKSSSTISGKFGGSRNAELQILCREGKTDAYFTFAGHFLADIEGYGELTVRIDKKPAQKISLSESTDHEALGYWNGTGIKFIRSLYDSSKLLVRVTPFNENSITTEFDISGLKESILPLAKACHWPSPS